MFTIDRYLDICPDPHVYWREMMLLSINTDFCLTSAGDGNCRSLFRYCCRSTRFIIEFYTLVNNSIYIQNVPLFLFFFCLLYDTATSVTRTGMGVELLLHWVWVQDDIVQAAGKTAIPEGWLCAGFFADKD